MKRIGIGRQAEVFEDNGTALKMFNPSVSVDRIEYEADLMKKVHEVYKRAPEFYGMHREDGRNGIKFELIRGDMLSNEFGRHFTSIGRYGRELGMLHREMHTYTVKGLPPAYEKFEWKLRRYKNLDENVLHKLLEFIKGSKEEALCHGDLHPENILVDGNGRMRVIDWADAYCGNPLSDVARTYYLLGNGISPYEKPVYVKVMEKLARAVISREYINAYFHDRAIPKMELDMWNLIIHICRHNEGIREELPHLEKLIPIEISKLGM